MNTTSTQTAQDAFCSVYVVTDDRENVLFTTERFSAAIRYAEDLSTAAAAINLHGEEGGRTLVWTAEDNLNTAKEN